jgi:hypothetical protein
MKTSALLLVLLYSSLSPSAKSVSAAVQEETNLTAPPVVILSQFHDSELPPLTPFF